LHFISIVLIKNQLLHVCTWSGIGHDAVFVPRSPPDITHPVQLAFWWPHSAAGSFNAEANSQWN